MRGRHRPGGGGRGRRPYAGRRAGGGLARRGRVADGGRRPRARGAAVRRRARAGRAVPGRRRGRAAGRGGDAGPAGRRAEAARVAERERAPHVRGLRRRERRLRDALRRRHPGPERHLAADLRQRRRRDGRHGARRGVGARDAGRALRRRDDARPDHAGRDAAARSPRARRPRARDLPRQRRRRARDGAPVRGGRAAGRGRLHAVRGRQLLEGRDARDGPGAADGRRPARAPPGRRPRLRGLLQPGPARGAAARSTARARPTSTTR